MLIGLEVGRFVVIGWLNKLLVLDVIKAVLLVDFMVKFSRLHGRLVKIVVY